LLELRRQEQKWTRTKLPSRRRLRSLLFPNLRCPNEASLNSIRAFRGATPHQGKGRSLLCLIRLSGNHRNSLVSARLSAYGSDANTLPAQSGCEFHQDKSSGQSCLQRDLSESYRRLSPPAFDGSSPGLCR